MPISLAKVGSVGNQGTAIPVNKVGSIDMPVETLREYATGFLGFFFIAIFGVAVFYLFHLGALLFTKFNGSTLLNFQGFVRDALNPFLKECATTLGTIFGSTLGFDFGYYFKAVTSGKNTGA